jgi:ATP-dependent RNA helicase SUPV3L1/SUV3
MHKTFAKPEDDAAIDEVPQPGGVVTTLHKVDLPILRAVLPMQLPSLQRAVLDVPHTTLTQLNYLLPQQTSFADLLDHLSSLALVPANTVAGAFEHKAPLADVVQKLRDKLTLGEMDTLTYSPVSTRDPQGLAIFTNIVKSFADRGYVEIDDVLEETKLLATMDMVEATLAVLPPLPPEMGIGKRLLVPPVVVASIPQLETLHKSLTLYIWLSFRYDIAFPDRPQAQNYKTRVEACLAECLNRMPGLRNKKTHERTKEGDRATADWRKANVAPRGTMKMPGAKGKGIEWQERAVVQRLKNKNLWRGYGITDEDGSAQSRSVPRIGSGVEPRKERSEAEVLSEEVMREGRSEVRDGVMNEETERIQRAVG